MAKQQDRQRGPNNLIALDEKYYEALKPSSFAERLAIRARDRIYDDFIRLCQPTPQDMVLDVGVSDVITDAANALERRYPWPERITAAGLGTAEAFRTAFPRVAYRQISPNEPLPFPDQSFDIVTSNAVLEHVGSITNQRRFVSDLRRVGRLVFITVPNRFFPVEHHTAIPLLHWSDSSFTLACRILGKPGWSKGENLILMSRRRLRALCADATIGSTGILPPPISANLYLLCGGRA